MMINNVEGDDKEICKFYSVIILKKHKPSFYVVPSIYQEDLVDRT